MIEHGTVPRWSCTGRGFGRQELTPDLETPAVATQAAVGSDDAVARDDQGGPVDTAGAGDGTHGRGGTEIGGHLAVGAGLTGRDAAQRRPHPRLERGPADVGRQGLLRGPPLSQGAQGYGRLGELVVGAVEPGAGQLGLHLGQHRGKIGSDVHGGHAQVAATARTVPTAVSTRVHRSCCPVPAAAYWAGDIPSVGAVVS